MAQRTVCLCDGKYIGIETIYTVINGQQINIPEKLKALRAKSQRNELFCPCGCGSNLILVAGDKNLKEQHFRLKDGVFNQACHVITEGKVSVDSKIVLKCWLDDKLKAADIETRVPICAVDDMKRKYEFSFLSREKGVALSYCHERVNLSDEKMEILEGNSKGIRLIYVVDDNNRGTNGQYPEGLMKIQNRQGYCLLLDVETADYSEAVMRAVFYAQDLDGLWQEIKISEGKLSQYSIDHGGNIRFDNELIASKRSVIARSYFQQLQGAKARRAEEEKQYAENLVKLLRENAQKSQEQQRLQEDAQKERQRQIEEAKQQRAKLKAQRRAEEEMRQAEARQREEDFIRNMESDFTQQETQVRDALGNRWIKCEFCGRIAKEEEFTSFGGAGHINLGTCKQCNAHNPRVKQKMEADLAKMRTGTDMPSVCPKCGGTLVLRVARTGANAGNRFYGCSNYPKCRYTKNICQPPRL